MKMLPSTQHLLHRLFGLSPEQVDKVLHIATSGNHGGAVYSDIYFEHGADQSVMFDQGVVKDTSLNIVRGAGVRVVIGDKTGYSYTDHVNVTNLKRAATIARAIAEYGSDVGPQEVGISQASGTPHDLYHIETSPLAVPLSEKIELVKKADALTRAIDARIKNVTASIATSDRTIIIANSLGHEPVVDLRPMIRMQVSCLAEENNRRETGSFGGGNRVEYSYLLADDFWKTLCHNAANNAIDLLSAEAAPAGEMTVVLGGGWPGVLFHEAVGHGLEGDFNRKGTSAFSKRIGEKVASELCTIIDDGTIKDRRGSLNVDDEGVPTTRTVLIENGILKGYLQDRMNGGLMGVGSTGNGRRQSYKFAPMPRMTNTFLDGGTATPEEIIRGVEYGIYAADFNGGEVDITSGKFTFTASIAKVIEKGKFTKTIKGATLVGNGPEALKHISAVGNDVALDNGIGTCGKNGQGVPVGVGMPTIRIDHMTLGGTKKAPQRIMS